MLKKATEANNAEAAKMKQAQDRVAKAKQMALDTFQRDVLSDIEHRLTGVNMAIKTEPMLGLLGTVIGMIEIFGSQAPSGTNPIVLAHGISIALYNTAMGLIVAIPSMIFYRYYRSKVDSLIVEMESQAIKLVEILHGERSH